MSAFGHIVNFLLRIHAFIKILFSFHSIKNSQCTWNPKFFLLGRRERREKETERGRKHFFIILVGKIMYTKFQKKEKLEEKVKDDWKKILNGDKMFQEKHNKNINIGVSIENLKGKNYETWFYLSFSGIFRMPKPGLRKRSRGMYSHSPINKPGICYYYFSFDPEIPYQCSAYVVVCIF